MYATAGHYDNHIRQVHPDKLSTQNTSLLRWATDISQPQGKETEEQLADEIFSGIEDTQDHNQTTDHDDLDAADLAYDSNTESDSDDESDDAEDLHIVPFAGPLKKATLPLQAQRQENFPDRYKARAAIAEFVFTKQRSLTFNHIYPFKNSRDYKLARHFTESEMPKHCIDAFLKEDILFLASAGDQISTISFKSGIHFLKG